jgi:hypothetical protein
VVRRGQRRVMEKHLASLHISNKAEAALGAKTLNSAVHGDTSSPGIGQLIPRGAPAPGGVREMVASASWMVCCSVWLADRVLDREAEFRPPMRAASAVPYGSAAAIGGEL